MRTRFATVLILVVALCGFTITNGYSFDFADNRESIRGIKGVYVMVEDIKSDPISDGLTHQTILNDVELRLRQNGIKVISREECLLTSCAMLHISPNFLKLPEVNSYTYCVNIQLMQDVKLSRNKYNLTAQTWSTLIYGIIPVKKLTSMREDIKDMVDNFINAYLSVNPKK